MEKRRGRSSNYKVPHKHRNSCCYVPEPGPGEGCRGALGAGDGEHEAGEHHPDTLISMESLATGVRAAGRCFKLRRW